MGITDRAGTIDLNESIQSYDERGIIEFDTLP
jgi:hypothetical protein